MAHDGDVHTMAESDKKQATAPYATWSSFKTFLEQLADRGLPQRIDRTVMSKMSGATQSNMRVALTFFKLTDTEWAPTDALKRLVASHGKGEDWKQALRDVIVTGYDPVLGELSLETGTAQQLWHCFREHGNVRGSTLSRAVRFFLAALREAEVKHSRYFVAPRRRRSRKGKQEAEGASESANAQPEASSAGKVRESDPDAEHEGEGGRSGWRSHTFHLPSYEEAIEVRAPREITKQEWDVINLFMTATIQLAKAKPAASEEDEG